MHNLENINKHNPLWYAISAMCAIMQIMDEKYMRFVFKIYHNKHEIHKLCTSYTHFVDIIM